MAGLASLTTLTVSGLRKSLSVIKNNRLAAGAVGVAAGAAGTVGLMYAARNTSTVSATDPFKGQSFIFPRDVAMHGNYMEMRAMATNGLGASALSGITGLSGLVDGVIAAIGSINTQNGGTMVLPLPNSLQAAHDPQYQEKDASGALGSAAQAAGKQADRALYGLGKINAGTALSAGAGAGLTAAASGGTGGLTDIALKLGLGVAMNPQKIMLFTGVGFRTFNYSWRLSPRNYEESVLIKNITNALTYYAHPRYVGAGVFLKYPEFFNIKFAKDGFLHKFQPAVIDNITVDYHPQGYAAYKRSDYNQNEPAPAEVQLNITFKEVEIVTKQSLSGILGTGFTSSAPANNPAAVDNGNGGAIISEDRG